MITPPNSISPFLFLNSHMKFLPLALFILTVGIILVILPDTGRPLIRFSENHGPSAVDVIGLTLILLVWMMMVYTAWSKRKFILATLGRVKVIAILSVIGLCSFLIPLGLKLESDLLLFGSTIVNVVCQVVLFGIAFRSRR
jgi:hypothetical protein